LTEFTLPSLKQLVSLLRRLNASYNWKNWKEHRMSSDRIPKMILKYQPKGKRNLDRPLKRWKDSVL
jgi:hypothetical protein